MVNTATGKKGMPERKKLVQGLRQQFQLSDDGSVRDALSKAILELEALEDEKPGDMLSVGKKVTEALSTQVFLQVDESRITENAKVVLEKRYLQRDSRGELVEDADGMFWRVAKAIAEIDRVYLSNSSMVPSPNQTKRKKSRARDIDLEVTKTAEDFYGMMSRLEFLPNSPTMMNAGTSAGTLSACFVLGLEDSMESIMDTAKHAAMVQKFGGGTGFALSNIRRTGAPITTTHGRACGPIAVLRHLSSVSTMVTQGGKRDGANMAVMDIKHPDINEFITAKQREGSIHNFNISVGASDDFMDAVEGGGKVELIDPQDGYKAGHLDANEVFEKIVEGAWRNGEPGMIFLDRVNEDNPTPQLGKITATNPCGEQPLLPYESCNLGSVNLARMLARTDNGFEVDWQLLRRTVRLAVHFLDNVIDANRYSVAEIERMTKLTRKVGLGVMGFADMLVRLGIPYDSDGGLEMGGKIMAFISQEADVASIELAKTRGPFPAFIGSKHDYPGGPELRNACRLTVAPTGTISMIAGCSSGIEPLFALAYRKQNILEGQTLYYINDAFEAIARYGNFYSNDLAEWLSGGNSLTQTEVPDWVKVLFTTAPEIDPEWHVRMQAAFQEHTDAAISKTINFPNSATVDDVRNAYLLSWNLGCKGITVYRAGSREKEVLTAGTQQLAVSATEESNQDINGSTSQTLVPRKRPQQVQGITERIRTGHGNMYVTINYDGHAKPFEVFTALGKAGSSDSAQLEAISRLVSMALRAGVDPVEVIAQLRGITDDPVWDGGVLVRSAPDAVALALARAIGYEENSQYSAQYALFNKPKDPESSVSLPNVVTGAHTNDPNSGSISGWSSCPECSGPLVFQEGCLMCRECGYNKCG